MKRKSNIGFFLVVGSLAVRLFSLFFVTPIDFRWESYHYWQIALYTQRVGISHGRMWDLGGMEYFWGPLPILVQSFLLWVLRTTSILPFRVLNTLLGSLTAYLGYLVGKRHFSERAGLISAGMIMLNPLLIFNNVIGMEATMGVFFVMLALSFCHRNDYLMGFFLALASLCRIEFWLLSFGISFLLLLFERGTYGTPFVMAVMGWLTPMFPYFIHLNLTTGNPIYPFYWNFIGNIAGTWTPWYVPPMIRGMFGLILVGALVGLFLLYKYRERMRGYVVYGVFLGFAAYHGIVYTVSGLAPLFERFFVLDAAVGSIVLSHVIFKVSTIRVGSALPRSSLSGLSKMIGVGMCLLIGLSNLYAAPYYMGLQSSIRGLHYVADQLGGNYTGGTVLCNMPMMTYRLIHRWRLSHENVLGTLYSPLDNVTEALSWLKRHNATWLVVAEPKAQNMYNILHPHHPLLFIRNFTYSGASLYSVNRTLIENLYP